jgi:hypothetical protein
MHLRLHANATTTPRPRAYIHKSQASNAALARERGIHSRTVARWKARQDVADRSTRPHRRNTSLKKGKRRWSSSYVAIDRATRFVYLEILPDRRADTAAGFLTRFRERFALNLHRAHRQRLQIHRPLCRRQKGQAPRQTVRAAPL